MTQAAQFTGYLVVAKGNTGRGIRTISQNSDYTIKIILTDGTIFTTSPIPGFTSVDLDENFDLVVTKTDGTEVTVETGLGDYDTTLSGYKTDAENAATSAGNSKDAASGSATTATQQATLARSYAKGDTSSRTGEATDNAEYFKGQASTSATSASSSASTAEAQALVSEGYAQGTQASTPVTSDSPYYHNNSKYFSELASASDTSAASSASSANTDALKAEGYAVGKQNGTTQTSGTYYHNNAQYYNSQATQAASISATQATASGTQALKSEGFAVGEQSGTPVTSGSDYYENNAKYYAGEAADSATAAAASAASIDPENMAGVIAYNKSATYPDDTVGKELQDKPDADGTIANAEQLTSNIYEEDSVPYNFRTSGGSIDIGDRETDMLVGGTVGWNQLIPIPDISTVTRNGITCTNNLDGTVTFNGTATADTQFIVSVGDGTSANPSHKYLLRGCPSNGSVSTFYQYDGYYHVDTGKGYVGTLNLLRSYFLIRDGVTVTNLVLKPQLFDLTAMFGSTIADYIYSLEQATAGAGVAWFRKLFPKPYYAYNAGELMSVQAVSHDMVGFNQWDEEWENGQIYSSGSEGADANSIRSKNYCGCVPNTIYHGKTPSTCLLCWYDESKAFIGRSDATNSNVISPSNARYFRISCPSYGSTYQNNICINLSWDGERDGEYEAYVKHSYPLDSSLTLRGIPKLDANNNLYYDGDTYESDGTVTRKYGIITFDGSSDETWSAVGVGSGDQAGRNRAFIVISGALANGDACASRYVLNKENTYYPYIGEMCINSGSYFMIGLPTTITTTEELRAMLAANPITLVYELATPTTETADAYTNPQIVNDFGTEEYVDYAVSQGDRDVSIPVGHYTQYMANLKAKLEMSPNSPEGAGDYIVRQTNGENEYVTLASNATIQDIIARLEALENAES